MAFAAAAVTSEKKASRETPLPPWPWKIFSLDGENLM
jgi:hypothetical protein